MQSVEMKPMFLPDVQNNPQPSRYLELIRSAQNSGQEYWQIWHLFAFRPEMTAHLARFTHGVMQEPAPLSSGLRELIAAYTSYLNQCEFCAKSHAAVSAELLGSEDLVWSVLHDLEGSSLLENEKALLRFVGKVTKDLPSVQATDTEACAPWAGAMKRFSTRLPCRHYLIFTIDGSPHPESMPFRTKGIAAAPKSWRKTATFESSFAGTPISERAVRLCLGGAVLTC
jgi:uncharacterized peroxidase-related enzyme